MSVLIYIAIAVLAIITAGYAGMLPAGVRRRGAVIFLFLLLFVPAALRQGIGNDYYRYAAFMHLVVSNAYVPTEWGFNTVVRVIYGLCGYENYLLVFAVFAAVTLFIFLKAICREAEDLAASFALFMLFGYYFNCYNTVRYYLALSIALLALGFIRRKEYVWFVIAVAAAASFHKSALVLVLLYPLCMIRWKRVPLIVLTAAGAVLSLFRSFWTGVFLRLYPSYEGTGFFEAAKPGYAGIARCLAILLLAVLAVYFCGGREKSGIRRITGESIIDHYYARMNYMALAIYVFGWFVPEISRIGHYLTITHIFYIPQILSYVRERDERLYRRFRAAVFAAAVLYFAAFLYKAWSPDISLLPYRTFLFHDLPDVIVE